MGKRGPSPAPTRLKVVRGDQESRINRNEPIPSDMSVVRPPEWMEGVALEVWHYYAADLIDKGCLTAWDVDTFAIFCNAVAIWRQADALLAQNGLVAQGAAGGVIKSPYHQIKRDCDQTIAKFSSRFGLTPGDRADLKVGEDNKPTNGAERILG